MSQNNPLTQYFRQFKKYVSLPSSKGNFLKDEVVEYSNDRNEVGVRPMTAGDEMLFKSPDALLNGDAIVDVIKSCVPSILQPKKLLTNDINALLVAIYMVSNNKHYDVSGECPKCGHKNNFQIPLDTVLDNIEMLDKNYPVNLTNGVTVFVSPHTYEMTLKAMAIAFQESRFISTIQDDDLEDEERIKEISKTINKVSQLEFELVSESVLSAAVNNNGEDLVIDDRGHLQEFIEKIESSDAKLIKAEIERINQIGVPNKFTAECEGEDCDNTWEATVDFNPTDFFTNS